MTAGEKNAYFRTKVMTASPAELRMMLLDGALRFTEQARDGLKAGNHELTYQNATKCQDILMELLSGLDREQAPELCSRLSGLYTYMYIQLMKATTERKWEHAEEVAGLLRYECETWRMVMDKLKAENVAAAGLKSMPTAEPTHPEAAAKNGPQSLIGGSVSFKA